jgi:acyl carrier protein
VDETLDALLRELIADQLGVLPDDLSPAVSLVDDLAADSLDLCEVGCVLEDRLGVPLPRRAMEQIRTYGDLLSAVARALAGARRRAEAQPVPIVRARLVPAGETRGGSTLRAARLSAYETELIADDALRAGPGARLAVELAGVRDGAACAELRGRLAPLARRGIHVRVRCDGRECRHGRPGAAA